MSESIKKSDIITGDPFGEIAKQINEALGYLTKFDNEVKQTAKDLSTLSTASTKTVQGIDAINRAEKESAKLVQDKLRNDKALEKMRLEEIRINKAREKSIDDYNKKAERESKIAKDSANAYKILERATRDQKNESKRLGAELLNLEANGQKNTKAFRDLERQYKETTAAAQKGDTQLKKLDKTVGDNFRNVGAYEKGVSGLKNMLGGLGVAIGVGSVFSSSVRTVSEFGDAVADLSAITGATGKDLDFFKKQSIEMGVNVKGGASAVVEAYKLIAGAKPELLTNAEALNSVTEAAILLSKASGMELPEAATALTDAMNQFGADADQASKFVDVLASGAKFGAAEIPQITEALLKFGAVAKTSNVNVQESTVLIETLAEKGLKGADAGTALRNVMLKLSAPDALGKDAQDRLRAMGINFEALSDKSKPFSERLAVLKPLLKDNAALVKVFGTENAVAATTLLSSTDRIKELTSQMDSNGVALEQQEAKSKTLSEAYNRLKETFNGFILNMSEGTGAASGLSSAMDFLSKNFNTIMSVLWQGVKVWGAYKAAMLAMDLKNRFNDWRALSKGVENVNDGLEKGAAGGKKFGAALKGIGFGLAITAALELVTAFYDIASGAEAARDAAARLDVQLAKSSKDAAARTSERTEAISVQIAELQRQRNENKITEKEFLEQKRALIDATKNEVKTDIQKVNARKAQYLEEKKLIEQQIAAIKAVGGIEGTAALRDLGFELNQVNANIQGSNTRLTEYYKELGAVGEATKDLTSDLIVETSTTNKSTAATREKTKSVQDLKNTVEDSHLTLEQMHEAELKRLEDEKAALDAIKTLSRELEAEMSGDSTIVDIDPEIFTEKELRSFGVMTDAYK